MVNPAILALHSPVLLKEVLEFLAPLEGKTIIDATVGTGGHAEAILEARVIEKLD